MPNINYYFIILTYLASCVSQNKTCKFTDKKLIKCSDPKCQDFYNYRKNLKLNTLEEYPQNVSGNSKNIDSKPPKFKFDGNYNISNKKEVLNSLKRLNNKNFDYEFNEIALDGKNCRSNFMKVLHQAFNAECPETTMYYGEYEIDIVSKIAKQYVSRFIFKTYPMQKFTENHTDMVAQIYFRYTLNKRLRVPLKISNISENDIKLNYNIRFELIKLKKFKDRYKNSNFFQNIINHKFYKEANFVKIDVNEPETERLWGTDIQNGTKIYTFDNKLYSYKYKTIYKDCLVFSGGDPINSKIIYGYCRKFLNVKSLVDIVYQYCKINKYSSADIKNFQNLYTFNNYKSNNQSFKAFYCYLNKVENNQNIRFKCKDVFGLYAIPQRPKVFFNYYFVKNNVLLNFFFYWSIEFSTYKFIIPDYSYFYDPYIT